MRQKIQSSSIPQQSARVFCFLILKTNQLFKHLFFYKKGPEAAQNVQKLIKERGYKFVDAPVSGGVPGAVNGTLTFMVGGKSEEFAQVKDVLQDMGGLLILLN